MKDDSMIEFLTVLSNLGYSATQAFMMTSTLGNSKNLEELCERLRNSTKKDRPTLERIIFGYLAERGQKLREMEQII